MSFNFNDLSRKNVIPSSRGVYCIECIPEHVLYVGSIHSKNSYFRTRWNRHIIDMKKGKGNPILRKLCEKYGFDSLSFTILEDLKNEAKEYILQRELYWINKLDTYNHGANRTLNVENTFKGFLKQPYTEEQKKKYLNTSITKKKVYMYDGYGNLLKEFESSCEADRYLGIRKGRVSEKISKRVAYKGKFFFSHDKLDNWKPFEERKLAIQIRAAKIAETRKAKNNYRLSDEQKNKIRKSNTIKFGVDLYGLEGNFVKHYISLNQCDDDLNLTRGTTSKVIKHKNGAKTLRRKYIPKLTS